MSTLLRVLEQLPDTYTSNQLLYVSHRGSLRRSSLPRRCQRFLQCLHGGYSKEAVLAFLLQMCHGLIGFEAVMWLKTEPWRRVRSGSIASSSVSLCLSHIAYVLERTATLQDLSHVLCVTYVTDGTTVRQLTVLTQSFETLSCQLKHLLFPRRLEQNVLRQSKGTAVLV